jgi:transposase
LLEPAGTLRRLVQGYHSMTEEEWVFFRRYVEIEGRGRPPSDHRRVLDAIFLVALTGQAWRDVPGEHWGSVYQQFRRWTKMGLWDAVLDDLEAASTTRGPHHRHTTVERVCVDTAGCRRLRQKIVAARALARRGHRSRKRPQTPSAHR